MKHTQHFIFQKLSLLDKNRSQKISSVQIDIRKTPAKQHLSSFWGQYRCISSNVILTALNVLDLAKSKYKETPVVIKNEKKICIRNCSSPPLVFSSKGIYFH